MCACVCLRVDVGACARVWYVVWECVSVCASYYERICVSFVRVKKSTLVHEYISSALLILMVC